ncbi:MAG: DUF1501 domain-containing protein, partial [Planctomycetota bacterium]
MHPLQQHAQRMTRRQLFGNAATGVGAAALATLLESDGYGASNSSNATAAANNGEVPQQSTPRFGGLPNLPHHAPRAKHVIYLFQNGAPTHVDLFDWKPRLQAEHGNPIPMSYIGDRRFSTMTGKVDGKVLLAPMKPFSKRGESGAWVSDLMPHTASIADELCFVKSLHTEQVNHAPAILFMLTGGEQPGRPSAGAWLSYALGSETQDLPSYVVMTSITKDTSCGQIFYDFYWGSGFLPTVYQGVQFRGG